jgi:hypothetical protein
VGGGGDGDAAAAAGAAAAAAAAALTPEEVDRAAVVGLYTLSSAAFSWPIA